MYKRLYLILSIMVFIISILLVGSLLIPGLGTLFPFKFFLTNFVSLIMLLLCSDTLIKNDEDKITKIISIVILICMFATIIDCHVLDIKGLSAKGTIIGTVANIISSFLTTSYSFIIPIIIYRKLEPSNKFSKILKKVGIVSSILTVLAMAYLMIQTESLSLITDLINYINGNVGDITKDSISKYGILIAAIGLEFGTIISAYLSEFAFDKGQRKEQRTTNSTVQTTVVTEKQTSDYFAGDANVVTNNTAVVMNMGNDLIMNSNVGQVDKPTEDGASKVEIVNPAPAPTPTPVVEQPVQEVKQAEPEPQIIKVGPVINESVANSTPAPAPSNEPAISVVQEQPTPVVEEPKVEQPVVEAQTPAPVQEQPVQTEAPQENQVQQQ